MKTVCSKWPEMVVSVPALHDVYKSRGVDLSRAKVFSAGSLPSLFHLAYDDEAPTCLDADRDGVFDVDSPLPEIEEELVSVILKSPSRSAEGVELHGMVYSKKAGLAVILVRWSEEDPIDISEGYNANRIGEHMFYGGGVNGLIVHACLTAVSKCNAPRQLPTFEDRHCTRKYSGLGLTAKPVHALRVKYHRDVISSEHRTHHRSEHERLCIAYVSGGDKKAEKHWSSRGYKKFTRRNMTGEMMSKLADRGRRMPGQDESVFVKTMVIPAAVVSSS